MLDRDPQRENVQRRSKTLAAEELSYLLLLIAWPP
jgi:hypothetical protein